MKTRVLLFSLLLGGLMAQAQTINVSGVQSGVWKADTVLVSDNVTIEDSLVIRPGTTVIFKDFFSIEAKKDAVFCAVGTETDSILFTVADTTGFHLFNVGRGGWNGIRLIQVGSARFDYCRFQYGKAALDDDQDGGALRIFGCDNVEISHSTLRGNFSREHGGALNAEHSTVTMHDCDVSHNQTYTELDTVYFMYGGGLRFINCEVDLTDMNFHHNDGHNAIGGALSLDSCSVSIDRCRFEHNHGVNGGGLYLIRSYDNPCRIANSLFANNISSHFGGGLAICDASPEVSNLTVTGNLSVGVNCGGIFFYQNSSPVLRNCIVYGNTCESQVSGDVQMWIWTYDDHVPSFRNCLIEYGLEGIAGHDIVRVYEDCLDEDPVFAQPDDENYRLGEGSPCINTGLTWEADLTAHDLDRSWRVCNNIIDMGAYEYSATGITETAIDMPSVRIVGNPITTESYAEIEMADACHGVVLVYSMDGKLLVSNDLGKLSSGIHQIGIGEMFAALPSGTYLLLFKVGNKTFTTKAIR